MKELKKIGYVIVAVCAVYLGALLEFPLPGTDIPQTGQTIAVLCVGALLGVWWGGAALALYLVLGVAGLPIFSDGSSGLEQLTGPTGGYLVGFVLAASFMGLLNRLGLNKDLLLHFAGMVLGHLVILLCGWVWLASKVGALSAYENGIAPFYAGAIAKSVIAVLLVWLITQMVNKLQDQPANS